MNKFNFKIIDESFSIDEFNYKSKFNNLIEQLTSYNWISNDDLHSLLIERGGDFFKSLRKALIDVCERSTDYEFHKIILQKLINIRKIIVNDTNNENEAWSNLSLIASKYIIIEKLSLVIELYEINFRKILSNEELNKEFLNIILYIEKGDRDYDHLHSIDINKLEYYIEWIKHYNKNVQKRYQKDIKIQNIEIAQKRSEEKNITIRLEEAWIKKKRQHEYIFLALSITILILLLIGCKRIETWKSNGNSAFDNCCEKMGLIELIYGSVVYWGFQYKFILLLVWFAAIKQLIEITKSQWHLINDASERIAIIETYKIFIENNLLGGPGKYMDSLLQSVFRSVDDGLLKDAKTILPSSLSDFESKTIEEK